MNHICFQSISVCKILTTCVSLFFLSNPVPPVIENQRVIEKLSVVVLEAVNLVCKASGSPVPEVCNVHVPTKYIHVFLLRSHIKRLRNNAIVMFSSK